MTNWINKEKCEQHNSNANTQSKVIFLPPFWGYVRVVPLYCAAIIYQRNAVTVTFFCSVHHAYIDSIAYFTHFFSISRCLYFPWQCQRCILQPAQSCSRFFFSTYYICFEDNKSIWKTHRHTYTQMQTIMNIIWRLSQRAYTTPNMKEIF